MEFTESPAKKGVFDIPHRRLYRRSSKVRQFSELVAAIFITTSLLYWNYGDEVFVTLVPGLPSPDIADYNAAQISELSQSVCPIPPELAPVDHLADITIFNTTKYREKSVDLWRKAIQIDTQVFDDNGLVPNDPRWSKFAEFHSYLKKSFPLVFDHSIVEHINTYGLIFTLPGSDESLKPLLLTAHQDVVPVPEKTRNRWAHQPFSGDFDGQNVWGRGSIDDKNSLIGIMEAMTSLLEQNFKPVRTIMLAFGFDEEISGPNGAKLLAAHLLEKLGPDSIYALIDEGSGLISINDVTYAMLGTSEKGYLDSKFILTTDGGHSSMPPKHTSIGIMSLLISEIEKSEFPNRLTSKNPLYEELKCMAVHGAILGALKQNILDMDWNHDSQKKVLDAIARKPELMHLLHTTQAIDVIRGGAKINALPEQVEMTVNSRIAVEESVAEVQGHFTNLARNFAKKHNLLLETYGTWIDIPLFGRPRGILNITALGNLEPAPMTHSTNPTFNVLAGTIRHVFSRFNGKNETIITTPSIMTGNTDTRYYWDLTDSIYRFAPMRMDSGLKGVHTVDESLPLNDHVEGVAFYYTLIRNVQLVTTDE